MNFGQQYGFCNNPVIWNKNVKKLTFLQFNFLFNWEVQNKTVKKINKDYGK